MESVRDLDTEAIAWTAHSLGLSGPQWVAAGLPTLPPHSRYLQCTDGRGYGVFVDLSNPNSPTLLLAPEATDLAICLEAFCSGHRTDDSLLSELRAFHKGQRRTAPAWV